jgi:hypothetical protein
MSSIFLYFLRKQVIAFVEGARSEIFLVSKTVKLYPELLVKDSVS